MATACAYREMAGVCRGCRGVPAWRAAVGLSEVCPHGQAAMEFPEARARRLPAESLAGLELVAQRRQRERVCEGCDEFDVERGACSHAGCRDAWRAMLTRASGWPIGCPQGEIEEPSTG